MTEHDRPETTERNPESVAAWRRRAQELERENAELTAALQLVRKLSPGKSDGDQGDR